MNLIIKQILIAIAGALIGSIATLIGVYYQNKRWVFTTAIDIRTKSILSAYNDFLKAFFNINKAANIGEDSVTFKSNINQPIHNYLVAINKIDIWLSEKHSNELREILSIFRKFSSEIYKTEGKQPLLKVNDWKTFSDSLDKMKQIVINEIRSDVLRGFIFSNLKLKFKKK